MDDARDRVRLGYQGPGQGPVVAMPRRVGVAPKVKSGQTGGAYSLFELEVGPGGGERPHIQHREDEFLYVLEGRFELTVEQETLLLAAGANAYIPRGTLHGFENLEGSPGKLLAIHTPGDAYERFVEEIASTGSEPEIHPDIAARHGFEICTELHGR